MIVALDLETTWVDREKDKIIEFALVKFDENTFEIIDTYNSFINPWILLPEIISNITNIFDDDLKDAPIFDEKIALKIQNFIKDHPILGHNTNFDKDFLTKYWIDLTKNLVLDTFWLANIVLFEEKSLNLWAICESLNINLEWAHRAINDTIATVKVFENIIKKIKDFSSEKKQVLNYIFSRSNQKEFKYYKTLLWFEENILWDDFINILLKQVWIFKEQELEKANDENDIFQKDLENIFKSFWNFEIRDNQLNMSKMVENTLKNNKRSIIEAPTWVWKTFAYLIPSIIYSLKNKEQVIISTNTKALQDQIFYKDLEFLNKNINHEFKYAKLKWRKNYFSISMYLNYFLNNEVFDLDETVFFSKLGLWLFKTEYWELDELNYYFKEYNLLKSINADNFWVLTDTNEYKHYEYIFKARSIAQKSNIVIINHSLLIQDITSSAPIFGQIKNLIIDESHNLEDASTEAFKKTFSANNLKDYFDKVIQIINKNNFVIENIELKFQNILSNIYLVFDILNDYMVRKNTYWNEVFELLIEKDFFEINTDILNILNNIEMSFIEVFNLLSTTPDKIFAMLKTEISNMEEVLDIVKIVLSPSSSQKFIPIFSYNKHLNSSISYTLLNPWVYLKTILWDKVDSLVLTSATLQINDSFDYIKAILCLWDDFEFFKLDSDFDYSKQALLYVPEDLWSVKYNNPKINDFLLEFLKIVKWNTLVLLTSFNAIKDLYLALNLPLKNLNTNVLAQNVGWSKHKIANFFKNHSNNSVILWTDSFWEWVDIPWDDLKYLVIHKFPFLVPTDPIFVARWKLFKDAFREYSIPKSIIKTKQWFGRLIRTKTDTWIVILLDDRYSQTNWWNMMRASFPNDINIKMWYSGNFLDLMNKKINK